MTRHLHAQLLKAGQPVEPFNPATTHRSQRAPWTPVAMAFSLGVAVGIVVGLLAGLTIFLTNENASTDSRGNSKVIAPELVVERAGGIFSGDTE